MDMKWFLIILIVISGLVGGGYFTYISAILIVPMLLMLLYLVFKNRTIRVVFNLDALSLWGIVAGYLVTTLWAVDSGMAFTGFIKFLPILLFFIILSYAVEKIEDIKQFLPTLGTIMTVVGVILTLIPQCRPFVMVAGRFAGWFQYPNTYALFMLICFIIATNRFCENRGERINYLNISISLLGIILSGSRITFGLLILCVIVLLIKNRKKNIKIFMAGIIMLAGCIIVVSLFNRYAVIHLISANMGTLWGRILYAVDALPFIIKHPFGIGYYGYFFIQQQIQTGVYSVVNIHNELLQLMLDIGWIPALLFYGILVKNIFSAGKCFRDRLVLAVILLHTLLDYDLQFLMLFFVLILFLDMEKIKEFRISVFTKIVMVITTAFIWIMGFRVGYSDLLSVHGMYEKSIHYYDGNTLGKLNAVLNTESTEKKRRYLEEIQMKNSFLPMVYSELGNIEFAEGNIEEFINYKDRAIVMAPYQYEEYMEYCEQLYYCGQLYLRKEDYVSARVCLEKMVDLQHTLEDLKGKTNRLAWKIKDKPKTEFDNKQLQMIDNLKRQIQ